MRRLSTVALVLFPLFVSCADEEAPTPASGAPETFEVQSAEFSLKAGDEKYFCTTLTLQEDLNIDHIDYKKQDSIHHLVLVRTLAPEPEGSFECNTFFKTTWIPLFANGTDNARLDVPAGASFELTKGTQLLIQLHTLNASPGDVKGSAKVELHRTAATPSKAGIYGFGTTTIDLPAGQATTLKNDCRVKKDVKIFAAFPHMHRLGTQMSFLVGPDENSLSEKFKVDKWDFDRQFIGAMPLTLKAGDLTRVVCSYNNSTPEPVKFGESTSNEMCFFTAFITDYDALDGCIDLGGYGDQTPGGGADHCGEVKANSVGIGAPCTKGGKECASGLACTQDLDGEATQGFCMKLGCKGSDECGDGARCCAPKAAGGLIKTCLPGVCMPDDCTPVD